MAWTKGIPEGLSKDLCRQNLRANFGFGKGG